MNSYFIVKLLGGNLTKSQNLPKIHKNVGFMYPELDYQMQTIQNQIIGQKRMTKRAGLIHKTLGSLINNYGPRGTFKVVL